MVLVVWPYIHIYSDKHTGACEEIKISPPNLSEGGSLRSPNQLPFSLLHFRKLFFEVNNLKQSIVLAAQNSWSETAVLCLNKQSALFFTRDFREISLCYLIAGHAEIVGSATMPG